MKVKIIRENDYYDLEKSVNSFLKEQERYGCKVLDIKYSGSGGRAPYGIIYWSAMVIME